MPDDLDPISATPLVSVVIPVHGRGERARASIIRLLDDRNRDFEIVVVDDGSTDDTAQSIRALADDRLVVVEQEHAGAARARNRGVETARADFIAFLDSDDLVEPGWIRSIVEAAVGGCDFFACACIERHPDGSDRVATPAPLGSAFGDLCSLHYAGTFAVRRRAFDDSGGYLPGLEYGENTQLLMRLGRVALTRPLSTTWNGDPLIVIHRVDRPYRADLYRRSGLATLAASEDMLRRDRTTYGLYLAITGVASSRSGHRREALALLVRAIRAEPRQWRHVVRLVRAAVHIGR